MNFFANLISKEPNLPSSIVQVRQDPWDGEEVEIFPVKLNEDDSFDIMVDDIEMKDIQKGYLLKSDGYRGVLCYFGYLCITDKWYWMDLMEGRLSNIIEFNEEEFLKYYETLELV